MTLGLVPTQGDLLRSTVHYCEGRVGEDSIYAVLHGECFSLFPDTMFADLFTDVGRRSVPPMIVAVVMVLQRIEGLSDRETVDRFAFDARWKYAAGGLDFDYPGFVHTVLVDMRARLLSAYDLMCWMGYDLMCRSRRGDREQVEQPEHRCGERTEDAERVSR
jgi:hypothetical protein